MSEGKSPVDILFREHSFEEIESVRDSLASEIDKRTELLKSIVKEKYKDVVDTSDGIQSLKKNLARVEESISQLDKSISSFHIKMKEPTIINANGPKSLETFPAKIVYTTSSDNEETNLRQLLDLMGEIWDKFDAGNLKACIKIHNDATNLANGCNKKFESNPILENIKLNLDRSKEIIKNSLWYKIQSVKPNQISVIATSDDEEDLYRLSLQTSIEFLVQQFRRDISDTSYKAQIRRYEHYSYFNTDTNTVDAEVNHMKPPQNGYLQIPKEISVELSDFLFNVCRAINTIAGFSLTKSSMLESLRLTLVQIIEVYGDLLKALECLKAGTQKRRALQLYFDLKYVRLILNSSKNLNLIDEMETKLSQLMTGFEDKLDRVELYVISDTMHANAINLSRSTTRLYGLLIPHLQ